jgi:predicted nucleic acid-binding protein
VLVTSWVTYVEVRRNLARQLRGAELREAKAQFSADLDQIALVAVDEAVCRAAAHIGEQLGVRSLDAIQLASAQRLSIPSLPFVTFDLRQAQAARSLGFVVFGS